MPLPLSTGLRQCGREVVDVGLDAAGAPEGVLLAVDGQGERRVVSL